MLLFKRTNTTPGKTGTLILISGFLLLVILIFWFNRPAFYDEDDYLLNVPLIHKFGFGKEYLLNLIGSAGPLYSAVHYFLEPFTRLQTPYIRLVNVLFLAGATTFIGFSLRQLKYAGAKFGLIIMAIPMTYVISGLALTEMPAMFFLSAGIYLMIKSIHDNTRYVHALVCAFIAGICISLAIIGRQPYLVILTALPVFFFNKEEPLKNIAVFLLTLISSLALPFYIFGIWQGLVAPADALFYATLANQGISYRPELFLLCLAYYAVVIVLIAPEFYTAFSKKELLLMVFSTILIAALNQYFDLINFLPLKPLVVELVSGNYIDFIGKLAGSFLAVTGIYFLVQLYLQLKKTGYKKELLFFAVSMVAIAFSCIKLTHGFSSRYAAQAIPFLIPFAAYFNKNNPYGNLRITIGVIAGVLSLVMFFLGSE